MANVLQSRSPLPIREKQYLTRDGDMVDHLCYTHYGSTEDIFLQAVFRRNFVLRKFGHPILPAGMMIVFPVVTNAKAVEVRTTKKWPSFQLTGTSVPRLSVKKDLSITPASVVKALEDIRRRRKITGIPFDEDPIVDVLTSADPWVEKGERVFGTGAVPFVTLLGDNPDPRIENDSAYGVPPDVTED